jgi:putative salt-induced outer membrane protein YdiY
MTICNKMTLPCVLVLAATATAVMAADAVDEAGWDTSLALGANLNQGNSDNIGINAALTTSRDYEKMEYRFGLEGNYGENTTTEDDGSEDTEKTTQNAKASANIKRKLGAPYVYSDNSILHDEIAEIDYRVIIGAGGGVYALDNEKDKLGLEAGLAYIVEEFESGDSADGLSLRLAARHDHTFTATAKCWAAVEYLPELDDFGSYLLNAELGTEAALNSTLSLRVVLQDRYDSEPPDELDENDLALIAALVYKP